MKNILKQRAQNTKINVLGVAFLSISLFLVTGCGEVDSGDGNVSTSLNLPVDSVLSLYCPDAGIAAEPCILDDPDNPYATTPITDDNKFVLFTDAPSNKSAFYLWATAQAMNPRGENQFYTAEALHGIYSESGSPIAREQTLKAYRSILDNYFNGVTFRDFDTGIFRPNPVRVLAGENMYSPRSELTPLFTNPAEALRQFGEWGYTYDAFDEANNPDGTDDFTRNF